MSGAILKDSKLTYCEGGHCPVKENCKRFIGELPNYQSYFVKIYTEIPGRRTKLKGDRWVCDKQLKNYENKH